MKKVHIGPIPPPMGGISVYLYRLSKIDKKSDFIDESQFHIFKWAIRQIFYIKRKNFIYHSPDLYMRFFFFLSIINKCS